MKKVKLSLNQLKVDSFETSKPKSKRGKVEGFEPPFTEDPRLCKTDPDWNTCYNCGDIRAQTALNTCRHAGTCIDLCE